MKQKIHAELNWGNLLQQDSIETGDEREWVLTLSWVSVETFLNVEYIEWTHCVNCAEASAKNTSSEYSRVQGLPPSAYSLFIYSSLFASINQSKALVASEVYHMVITAKIRMKRM